MKHFIKLALLLLALLLPATAMAMSDDIKSQDVITSAKSSLTSEDPHMTGAWIVLIDENNQEVWYAMTYDEEDGDWSFMMNLYITRWSEEVPFYFMVDGVRYGAEVNMSQPWIFYEEYLFNIFISESENYFCVPVGFTYSWVLEFIDDELYLIVNQGGRCQEEYYVNAYDFIVDDIYYSIIDDDQTNKVCVTYQEDHYIDYYHDAISDYSGDVVIPETVSHDGVTYSVTIIGGWAFVNCSELTSVSIPCAVTSIDDCAFAGCNALTDVYSYIVSPSEVTMGSEVFFCWDYDYDDFDYSNRTLHVPAGSLEAYQANPNWGPYFGNIVEMVNVILSTSIELNENSAELITGETLQLAVTVLPTDATDKTVTWTSSAPAVASVDENGLVTAVGPGSATITVTTTDGSDLSASCVVTVTEDLSDYDNYLSLNDVEAFHGDTIVIPVAMTNAESIIAFQTDIFMPEGLEIVQEDGDYLIDPSSRMTRTHTIMSNAVSSGAVRVICYSSNYKPFTGNSGDDLFYITVKVADDAEGDYTIQLKNTLLTNTDFVDLASPDVVANVNVKAYLLGDANNSGSVTVTDVVVTAQYVLELDPDPFIYDAADVNFDGNITVADVSRIAWMVLNPTLNVPRRAPALRNNGDSMSGEDITLAVGETRTVSIALDN